MEKIRKWISEENPDALFLTEEVFDKAIVGLGHRCGQPSIVVYDAKKVIECYVERGMSFEDAVEFFEFNTAGAWVGENTPLFVYLPEQEDLDLLED